MTITDTIPTPAPPDTEPVDNLPMTVFDAVRRSEAAALDAARACVDMIEDTIRLGNDSDRALRSLTGAAFDLAERALRVRDDLVEDLLRPASNRATE